MPTFNGESTAAASSRRQNSTRFGSARIRIVGRDRIKRCVKDAWQANQRHLHVESGQRLTTSDDLIDTGHPRREKASERWLAFEQDSPAARA